MAGCASRMRQSKSATGVAVSSLAVTFDFDTAATSAVLVGIMSLLDGAAGGTPWTVDDNNSNTYVEDVHDGDGSGNLGTSVFSTVNISGRASHAVTWHSAGAAQTMAIGVHEVTYLKTTGAVDRVESQFVSTPPGTAFTSGAVAATQQAEEFVFGALAYAGILTITPDTGWRTVINVLGSGNQGLSTFLQTLSATGTPATSGNFSIPPSAYTAVIATYKASKRWAAPTFYDTCTDSDGTAWESHTPDIGSSPTAIASGLAINAANQLKSATGVYKGTTSTAIMAFEYTIPANEFNPGDDLTIRLRYNSAAENYYRLHTEGSATGMSLRRYDAASTGGQLAGNTSLPAWADNDRPRIEILDGVLYGLRNDLQWVEYILGTNAGLGDGTPLAVNPWGVYSDRTVTALADNVTEWSTLEDTTPARYLLVRN